MPYFWCAGLHHLVSGLWILCTPEVLITPVGVGLGWGPARKKSSCWDCPKMGHNFLSSPQFGHNSATIIFYNVIIG